jgi:hypothetical protein
MIRFRCPICRHESDEPDEQSGRVIPCPSCGEMVRLPALEATIDPLPGNTNYASSPLRGRIRFSCPSCGIAVSAPSSMAGGAGKCDRCGTAVHVPDLKGDSSRSSGNAIRPALVSCHVCNRNMSADNNECPHCGTYQENLIRFQCSNCEKPYCVPRNLAGFEGRCEECESQLQVPLDAAGAAPKDLAEMSARMAKSRSSASTHVQVSAILLSWPGVCACCCHPNDSYYSAMFTRITGERLIRTHSRS